PRIFASHHRAPTNRKRQSWKNSGGLPSKACPTNWKIQPTTNSVRGIFQNPAMNGVGRTRSSERMIIGMPMVWQRRLAAFWWLDEYCAIQSLHDLPKNIA